MVSPRATNLTTGRRPINTALHGTLERDIGFLRFAGYCRARVQVVEGIGLLAVPLQFYRGNFAAAEGRGEYLRKFQDARMISATVL